MGSIVHTALRSLEEKSASDELAATSTILSSQTAGVKTQAATQYKSELLSVYSRVWC